MLSRDLPPSCRCPAAATTPSDPGEDQEMLDQVHDVVPHPKLERSHIEDPLPPVLAQLADEIDKRCGGPEEDEPLFKWPRVFGAGFIIVLINWVLSLIGAGRAEVAQLREEVADLKEKQVSGLEVQQVGGWISLQHH